MSTPDRIKISEEFNIGKGLWLSAECPIAPGEDVVQEFLKARETLKKSFQAIANPDQVPISEALQGVLPETQVEKVTETRIGLIAEDILSCPDLKVLDSYKLMVKGKPELEAAFNKRLKELQ